MTKGWSGALFPPVRAELVETWACWFEKHACVEGGGRESLGMRVTFFCVAKRKSPKKRRPPVCDPNALRRWGKPASGRLRGAPWNSLCAARAARTATASQLTMRVCPSAHPLTPQPPRRRRSQQGWGAKQPMGHCFARPKTRVRCAPRPRGRAKRRPVWLFAGFPSVRAEKRRTGGACVCRRTHALRALTCRSCLNGARSAQ